MEELHDRAQSSLVVPSLPTRLGVKETTGDGIGAEWYGDREKPNRSTRSLDPVSLG